MLILAFLVFVNIRTILEYRAVQEELKMVEDSFEKLEQELKIKQQQLNILQDSVEKGRNEDN